MTTNNPGENDIDTLAMRAKEMLERVRGAADPGAFDTPLSTLTSNSTTDVEETLDTDDVDGSDGSDVDEAVVAEDIVDEVSVDETAVDEADFDEDETAADDAALDEAVDDDAISDRLDDLAADARESLDSDTDADEIQNGDVDEDYIDEFEIIDDADEAVFETGSLVDEAGVDDAIIEDDPEVDHLAVPDLEDDVELPEADFAEAEVIEADLAELDELDLGAIDLEDLDDLDTVDIDDDALDISESSENEFGLLDGVDVDGEDLDNIDIDDIDIDDAEPFGDADTDEATLGDDADTTDSGDEKLSLFGRADDRETSDDASEMDTVDESIEDSPQVFELDEDNIDLDNIDLDSIDLEAPTTPETEELIGLDSQPVPVADLSETVPLGEPIRERGRLSDLSPPVEKPTQGRSGILRRKPAVDHDLNDLFIKSSAPDQAVKPRNYSWVIPVVLLALAVLAMLYWLATSGGESDAGSTTDVGTLPEDSATATTVDAATSVQDTTTAPTTTAALTTTQAPTFANAWELIGEESRTSSFAALAGPIGLQQALELQADADGNPVQFTLFAPSNEAIAKLSQDQLNELTSDKAKAAALFEYHFVDQALTAEFLAEATGGQIESRTGAPIFVDVIDDEFVFNNEARIELDALEAQNGSIIVIDTVLTPPTVNALLDLGNIQFKVISSVITDEGKAELQKAVAYFNENPEATVIIEGHTDTDGEAEANRNLSQRRAEAVRQFLIAEGIDGSRLEAIGFGEDEPIFVGDVEDKNASRRIEFVLQ